MRTVRERSLFESVVEPFLLGDLEGRSNALIIRPKPKKPGNQRLVGTVTLARARKGSVKLHHRALWGATHETTAEQAESARARGVTGGGSDHYRTDNVEQRYHNYPLIVKG
jgi:hypothetical protein